MRYANMRVSQFDFTKKINKFHKSFVEEKINIVQNEKYFIEMFLDEKSKINMKPSIENILLYYEIYNCEMDSVDTIVVKFYQKLLWMINESNSKDINIAIPVLFIEDVLLLFESREEVIDYNLGKQNDYENIIEDDNVVNINYIIKELKKYKERNKSLCKDILGKRNALNYLKLFVDNMKYQIS